MAAPETPSPLSFRPIGELRALERNARKHPESQLLQLMRLIEEYGFTAPIVADERSILAGHGRLTAATRLYAASKRLSMPDGSGIPDGCVPVLNCSGWSDAKRRAYALADNKVALRSTWDYNLLAVELRVCITSENNIILREGGTLCYVGWPQSVLEGAQWKRAELVPADPFADPPRSYSQDNDLP
jgi:hypothetical protein